MQLLLCGSTVSPTTLSLAFATVAQVRKTIGKPSRWHLLEAYFSLEPGLFLRFLVLFSGFGSNS